jgi:hypothetical protein
MFLLWLLSIFTSTSIVFYLRCMFTQVEWSISRDIHAVPSALKFSKTTLSNKQRGLDYKLRLVRHRQTTYIAIKCFNKVLKNYDFGRCKTIIFTTIINGKDCPPSYSFYNRSDLSTCHLLFIDSIEYFLTCEQGFLYWSVFELNLCCHNLSDSRRISRIPKFLLSHLAPSYKTMVYVDASRVFLNNPADLLSQVMNKNRNKWVIMFRHPDRTNIFQEAEEIKILNIANAAEVNRQVQMYEADGLDKTNHILTDNSVIIFYNHPAIKVLWTTVYDFYMDGCVRDQLPSPYVIWKLNLTSHIAYLRENRRAPNSTIQILHHKTETMQTEVAAAIEKCHRNATT